MTCPSQITLRGWHQLDLLLLLLLLVSLRTGTHPHIEHIPPHHLPLASLRGEQDLHRPPVYAANIRPETHELDLLTDPLRPSSWGHHGEGDGQPAGGCVLLVGDVVSGHSDEVLGVGEVVVGWVGELCVVGAPLDWLSDVVCVREDREESDVKTWL